MWFKRAITPKIEATLKRGKSVLLLGPRQSGKTSLVKKLQHDIYITLMHPATLQKYESNASALISEITAQEQLLGRKPIVIIDEIQKIPSITDSIQVMIDENVAQFIITGSSARKIKNLLPGRVIKYVLTSLSLLELALEQPILENLLVNGSLPEIYSIKNKVDANELLESYVNLYIEEEIRKEALVRNIGSFVNFFKFACRESGNIVNLRKISMEVGVSHQTIAEYYRILNDCFLIERIESLSNSSSRRRLTKAPKFVIFDLGVKRIGSHEPYNLGVRELGFIFEQFVGLELCRIIQQLSIPAQVLFWRSHDGPEIDYVISINDMYIPIEVKWTNKPNQSDIKHILTFKLEYNVPKLSYVICRCDVPMLLADGVMAMPWQELPNIIRNINPAQ